MKDKRKLRKSPEGIIQEYLPSIDVEKSNETQEVTYSALVEAVLSRLEKRAKEVLLEHGLSIDYIEETVEKDPETGLDVYHGRGYSARAEQRDALDRAYFALMIMHHVEEVRSFLDYGAAAAAWAMCELSQAACNANLLVEEKNFRRGKSVTEGGVKGGLARHGTEADRTERRRQYREDFDLAIKSGAKKEEAYEKVAKKHEVHPMTIRRAIKKN